MYSFEHCIYFDNLIAFHEIPIKNRVSIDLQNPPGTRQFCKVYFLIGKLIMPPCGAADG